MKPIRAAIVDDEPPARRKMRRLVESVNDAEIVGEAGTGAEGVRMIREVRPALLFLDIQLSDMNGFQVLETVGPAPGMHVVFVTAFDHHAVQAFEVRALDYLLKPVAPSRFGEMMNRVRERLRGPAPLALDTGSRVCLVAPAEITLAESARNYVLVHARGETIGIRSTLEAFAVQLDAATFVRINRSQVINLAHVREWKPVTHGDYRVKLQDGTEAIWSRRYSPRTHLSRLESR